jgi:hypothetical protein
LEFASKELMLEYARKLAKKKFNLELEGILKESTLLRDMKQQSKLIRFL